VLDSFASDYYYPAHLFAAFPQTANGILMLPAAWALISAAPAAPLALPIAANSRRTVAPASFWWMPKTRFGRIVAVISPGRLVHLTDAGSLLRAWCCRLPFPA